MTASQGTRARKCRKCAQPASRHCTGCQVCTPRESEHPYWCESASRYQRKATS